MDLMHKIEQRCILFSYVIITDRILLHTHILYILNRTVSQHLIKVIIIQKLVIVL